MGFLSRPGYGEPRRASHSREKRGERPEQGRQDVQLKVHIFVLAVGFQNGRRLQGWARFGPAGILRGVGQKGLLHISGA